MKVIGPLIAYALFALLASGFVIAVNVANGRLVREKDLGAKLSNAQRLYSEADRERDDLLLYKRRREAEDARVKKLLDSGRFLPLPLPR